MSIKLTAQIVLLARDRTINAGFVAEKTRCPLRNAQRNIKALHECGILEVDRVIGQSIFYKLSQVAV